MLTSPVVVGIRDGLSRDVVLTGLAEAVRLGRPLRIVHVVEWADGEDTSLDDLAHDPEVMLAPVPVERVTLLGDPAEVLLAESATACRIVLGADDPALTPAHWSEVAQQVALHATVPVVVVPRGALSGPDACVLVGVDDAHPGAGPMTYAVGVAEHLDRDLRVVFAAGTTSDYPGRVKHLGWLEDFADHWRQLHPSVRIQVSVEGGHPVESCLAAGSHACLVVLGRPAGKHPRVGSRSVASRILRGSSVPVALVPLDYAPAPEEQPVVRI